MATLSALQPGTYDAVNSTNTNISGTDPVLELIASSDTGDFVYDATNTSHTGVAYFALADMPSDFGTMATLSVRLQYGWESGTQVNTWTSLTAQVYQSDRSTALTAEATVASSITVSTPTTSSVVNFTGVDTSSNKSVWDGAVLAIRFAISKNKGGDTVQKAVYAGELTGTYNVGAINADFDATESGIDNADADADIKISAAAGFVETGADDPAITAEIAISCDAAFNESGIDALSADIDAVISAVAGLAESGNDVFSADGALTDASITGDFAAQESGSDVFAGQIAAAVTANLPGWTKGKKIKPVPGWTTGKKIKIRSAGWLETGDDAIDLSASLSLSTEFAAIESGSDVLSADGSVVWPEIYADFNAIESISDAIEIDALIDVAVDVSAAESSSDIFAANASGLQEIFCDADIIETGIDTFDASASALPSIIVEIDAVESGSDTLSGGESNSWTYGTDIVIPSSSWTTGYDFYFAPIDNKLTVEVLVSVDAAIAESSQDVFSAITGFSVSADFAAAESGSDDLLIEADIIASCDMAATESGFDTFAADSAVTWPGITASISLVESGSDSASASGYVSISSIVAAIESSDIFIAESDVQVSGAINAAESVNDNIDIDVDIIVTASMAVSETYADDAFSADSHVVVLLPYVDDADLEFLQQIRKFEWQPESRGIAFEIRPRGSLEEPQWWWILEERSREWKQDVRKFEFKITEH